MKIERTTKEIPAKIEITEVFIANDGTKFYSLLECLDHENKLKLLEAKKLIKNIYSIELSDLSILGCMSAKAYYINNKEEFDILYAYAMSNNLESNNLDDSDEYSDAGWYILTWNDGYDYKDYTQIASLKSIMDEYITFLGQFTKTVI